MGASRIERGIQPPQLASTTHFGRIGADLMGTPKQTWTRAITPGTPVHEAAAVILQRRLREVARLLPRAAAEKPGAPGSGKRVHALRVATRRAAAAMDVFRETLDDKDRKRVAKRLRTIRRAAGAARDLDVQLELLSTAARGASSSAKSAFKRLIRETKATRQDACEPLAKLVAKWPAKKLLKQWEGMVARSRAGQDRTLEHAAHDAVFRAQKRVERAAAADLTLIENVHVLRLKLKRLRYAMEAVGVCFGDAWNRRIQPQLVSVQGALGEINDAHVLLSRMAPAGESEVKKRARPLRSSRGLAPIVREQQERLARSHAAFLDQWRTLVAGGFLSRLREEMATTGGDPSVSVGGSAPEPVVPTVPTRVLRPFGLVEPKPAALNDASGNGARSKPSGSRGAGWRKRLAAIDVGTNSIRLIVAEAAPDGSYRILDDEKEITRLGKGLNATGKLSAEAIEHSVVTIVRMKSIAEGYGAQEIQVVGTSAAREAKNGSVLVKQVRERAGLDLKIISGQEEAMLAYRSAANAFDFSSVAGAVVDIGGGSTEIILSAAVGGEARADSRRAGLGGGVIERVYSIPLGAVRLTDQFGGPEQCSGKRFEEMCDHIKQMLREHIGRAPFTPQLVVGTGGTLTTLASMVLLKELGPSGDGLFSGGVQGLEVGRADLRHLLEYLRTLPVKERSRVAGLSADRADIIVAGLAIIDGVLKRLGANRVRVHEGGIRDGILLSMVGDAHDGADGGSARRDPMRSVRRFAKSCAYEAAHAKHVTELALQIFDQLAARQDCFRPVPGLEFGAETRLMLEAAALLHDIGYLINYAQHHKHSYHLIVHADLPGLTTNQIQVIANIARYHRAADPKLKHRPFAMLSEQDRSVVRALSGILRIADGLDRTHMQSVSAIELKTERGQAYFEVASPQEPAVDLWGAVRKAGLFKEVFGLQPHFAWRPPAGLVREITGANGKVRSVRA